jgi:hypothetical protein
VAILFPRLLQWRVRFSHLKGLPSSKSGWLGAGHSTTGVPMAGRASRPLAGSCYPDLLRSVRAVVLELHRALCEADECLCLLGEYGLDWQTCSGHGTWRARCWPNAERPPDDGERGPGIEPSAT